jgi:hypothetical protein
MAPVETKENTTCEQLNLLPIGGDEVVQGSLQERMTQA